jgi:hypothetical protein
MPIRITSVRAAGWQMWTPSGHSESSARCTRARRINWRTQHCATRWVVVAVDVAADAADAADAASSRLFPFPTPSTARPSVTPLHTHLHAHTLTCPHTHMMHHMQVPYFYKYIKTPLFVSENAADSYQAFVQGGCPKVYSTYQAFRLIY